jgi:hypothetical protein
MFQIHVSASAPPEGDPSSTTEQLPLLSPTSVSSMIQPAGAPWARPGILVLSATGKVLYANERAHYHLGGQRDDGGSGRGDEVVMRAMTELINEMMKGLACRTEETAGRQLEARRRLRVQGQPILLRVFGIPDRSATQRPRIVVTVDEPGLSDGPAPWELASVA